MMAYDAQSAVRRATRRRHHFPRGSYRNVGLPSRSPARALRLCGYNRWRMAMSRKNESRARRTRKSEDYKKAAMRSPGTGRKSKPGQGGISDQNFLEHMARSDDLVDHDRESCGMCHNIILEAKEVAREVIEAGESPNVVANGRTKPNAAGRAASSSAGGETDPFSTVFRGCGDETVVTVLPWGANRRADRPDSKRATRRSSLS